VASAARLKTPDAPSCPCEDRRWPNALDLFPDGVGNAVRGSCQAMAKLTAKQERFVEQYLIEPNATQAAIRAGYSAKTAREIGPQNLKKLVIAVAIEKARAKRAEHAELTADLVIDELRKIAFANLADYVSRTPAGEPHLDFAALTRDQAAALSEVMVANFVDGDGAGARPVRSVRFKLYDKRAALVDLGRHLGFFEIKRQRHEATVEVDIEDVRDTILRTLARLSAARIPEGGGPVLELTAATQPPK
jgi:phage terminase small subunit